MPEKDKLNSKHLGSAAVRKFKKMPNRTRTALITAVVLFVITFLLQFVLTTVLPIRGNTITDWRFVSGSASDEIEGDLISYKQATNQNRISKGWGANYMRLQYTISANEEPSRLIIKTAHNPLRVEIDGKQVYNNGYGECNFTGNSYQSIPLNAGNEKILDIYLYAPLAFSIEAYVESAEISLGDSFSQYIGFGISMAIIFVGVGLFLLSLLLAARSQHIRRLLLLSVAVFWGGITALLYTYTQNTSMLASPYWFPVLLLSELLLMILAYITILSCCDKAFKNALVWIPVVIFCAIIPIFPSSWALRAAAVVMTIAQLFIALKANAAFAESTTSEVPYVGTVRGLLFYAALVGIYNTCNLFLGMGLLSGYLFFFSITMLCIVIFVVYCRQIIYLDIKKYERIRQLYTDSAWIEDITSLIANMFLQKQETTFLVEIARGLSDIVEKNLEINDEKADVYACVGVRESDAFVEIYNNGPVEACDYMSVYNHLDSQPQKYLIGNTTADMLFQMDHHNAVIHFENILCGVTPGVENIIKTAYFNLSAAYQNLNLKNDVSDIQEELFINLAAVVEQKYKMTKSHLIIVSALSFELARELGMNDEKAQLISLAAMTHDIGKIGISESIMEKDGPLDADEYEQMKQHTEVGFNILSLQKGKFFETAAVIARQHHENFDGSGYMGLKGRQIHPAARIVRVIDVADALLSKRIYKEAWTAESVKQYIEENKGTLFDPSVADAFRSCADELFSLRERILEDESQ